MSVATKRTCRTCPMVVAEGADQCRACTARSAAIRAVVKPDRPPAAKPRPRTCEQSHLACPHHVALVAFLVDWSVDMGMCPVCGADVPEESGTIEHKAECLLMLLIPAPGRQGEA